MKIVERKHGIGVTMALVYGSLLLWLGCNPKGEEEEPCKDGLKMCGGVCTDMTKDVNNCGECKRTCTIGQSCTKGRCEHIESHLLSSDVREEENICEVGKSLCGGTCVSTTEDVNHCGACGITCTIGQSCIKGRCKESGGEGEDICEVGRSLCGSTCVSTTEDVNHCGACGITCTIGQSCIKGRCKESGEEENTCVGQCPVGSIEFVDNNLQDCIMETITEDTPVEQVTTIECPNRNIQSAQGLQPFVQVQRLDLHSNKITTIAVHTFAGLTNLQTLLLYSNQIGVIAKNAFTDLTNLQTLSFVGNKIRVIEKDTFKGLTNLQTLSLGSNQIRVIEANAFADLTKLERLFLFSNQISTIAVDTFAGLENLKRLLLHNNQISTIAANAFANLTKLERLYLSGNKDGNGALTLSCTSLSALLDKLSERTPRPPVLLERCSPSVCV